MIPNTISEPEMATVIGCIKTRRIFRNHNERCIRIMKAAFHLFSANGFYSTGMAQIAEESGIYIGQIYRDFINKDNLINQIFEENCRRFIASSELKKYIATNDSDSVRRWLLRLAEPLQDSDVLRLFAETWSESFRNERIALMLEAMQYEIRASFVDALDYLTPTSTSVARKSVIADTVIAVGLA